MGFGAFGKMPSLGDFFRLNTPAGFVTVWDDWMQMGMISAREALGDGWQDAYMSAPIWRFTLAPGLAGATAVSGVLMPSVDRVGRQFPLTLMRSLSSDTMPAVEHFRMGPEFEELEDLALSTLENDLSREDLEQALTDIVPTAWGGDMSVIFADGQLKIQNCVENDPANFLAGKLIDNKFETPSLWSALTPVGMRLFVCEGLPNTTQMRGVFDLNADTRSGPLVK